jgi:phosphoribosylcarboxyaminoimidazole (NCAIR) mutase
MLATNDPTLQEKLKEFRDQQKREVEQKAASIEC